MHYNTFFHFFRNRELNELYISIAIRAFALAMSGIFIPIYLYQLGYSFVSIFFFYGIFGLVHSFFSFPAAQISSRFGLKHSMLISIPILIAFFILLYTLESFQWPLIFLAVILGLSTALFWVSYHIDFSKFSSKRKRGMQVGFSKITASVFAAAGPAAGGFVLAIFGFKVLFILVSILLLASVLPLFLTHEIHEPTRVSFKGFFKGHKLKDVLGFLGYGAEIRLGTIVWPLFIFIFILGGKYVTLGLVSSLALATSIIFTFLAGNFSDIGGRRSVLKIGVIANSIVWVVKSFIVTPLQVFIADAFYGASQATIHVPFDAINYDKGKERKITMMIIQREFYIHLGSFIFFMALIFLTDSLVEVFRYGGPLTSLMRFFF